MYKKVLLAAFACCITGNLYSAKLLTLLQEAYDQRDKEGSTNPDLQGAYDQLAQEAVTDLKKNLLLMRISIFPKVHAACIDHPPKNANEVEGCRQIETEYHAVLDEFFAFMIQKGHLKK